MQRDSTVHVTNVQILPAGVAGTAKIILNTKVRVQIWINIRSFVFSRMLSEVVLRNPSLFKPDYASMTDALNIASLQMLTSNYSAILATELLVFHRQSASLNLLQFNEAKLFFTPS